jgi:hypothetical protein
MPGDKSVAGMDEGEDVEAKMAVVVCVLHHISEYR